LRHRFASLDRMPVPDVWDDIQHRLDARPVLETPVRIRRRDGLAGPAPTIRLGDRADGPSVRWLGLLAAAALLLAGGLLVSVAGRKAVITEPSVVPPPRVDTSIGPTGSPSPSPSVISPSGLV